MKRIWLTISSVLMILSVFTGCDSDVPVHENESTQPQSEIISTEVEEEATPIRLMTSNIWGDYSDNEVAVREDKLYDVYEKYAPDVIGMQEVTENWHNSALFENLTNAGYTLLDDIPGPSNNYTPIFVNSERFNVIESGYANLRSTNDNTKSIQWGVLEDKEDGTKFAVCNTHFEYRSGAEYDAARESNAQQLATLMLKIKEDFGCTASFGMGDMNANIYSSVFTVYDSEDIQNLADIAPEKPTCSTIHRSPVRGPDGQFHGLRTGSPFENSIDHIVGTEDSYSVVDFQVVIDQEALDATDHSPVFADIKF